MYKIEYLETALKDLEEIASYITDDLQNPSSALKTTLRIVEDIERIRNNPYVCSAYRTRRKLKHVIRYVVSGSYIAFFWVTETTKTITVAAIMYGKRNILNILESYY